MGEHDQVAFYRKGKISPFFRLWSATLERSLRNGSVPICLFFIVAQCNKLRYNEKAHVEH